MGRNNSTLNCIGRKYPLAPVKSEFCSYRTQTKIHYARIVSAPMDFSSYRCPFTLPPGRSWQVTYETEPGSPECEGDTESEATYRSHNLNLATCYTGSVTAGTDEIPRVETILAGYRHRQRPDCLRKHVFSSGKGAAAYLWKKVHTCLMGFFGVWGKYV